MKYPSAFFCKIEEDICVNLYTQAYPSYQTNHIDDINYVLKQLMFEAHYRVVNALISLYMVNRCVGFFIDDFSTLFTGKFHHVDLPHNIDLESIPAICEELHISYLNSKLVYRKGKISRIKSKSNLLEAGAVYTQEKTAYEIVSKAISNARKESVSDLRILDFATGTGRFYKQIVLVLNEKYNIKPEDAVLKNVYAIDNDPIALNICRINAISLINNCSIEYAKQVSTHILLRNGLIKEGLFDIEHTIKRNDANGLFYNGFDVVVSNPPYLVLKPNKNKMDTATIQRINKLASFFRNSNQFHYAVEGMLNLYQLSIEAMIGMLKMNGELGVICPSTLFADISASMLRKYLLSNNKVTSIYYFSEDASLFENVTQATCIFHLTKGGCTDIIDIHHNGDSFKIKYDDIKKLFKHHFEIPPIKKIDWDILKRIAKIPSLKEQKWIRNKRGELDLTLHKKYITNHPTGYRLVRGNMLGLDGIKDINHEYVLPTFFESKSYDYMTFDKGQIRLVCPQISNQQQLIRLRFLECETNDVLGNSCNYIVILRDGLHKLKAILNSSLLNWRFKITSSNNHINNYEIDDLPIIDINQISNDSLSLERTEREKFICTLYGLNQVETEYITGKQYDTI